MPAFFTGSSATAGDDSAAAVEVGAISATGSDAFPCARSSLESAGSAPTASDTISGFARSPSLASCNGLRSSLSKSTSGTSTICDAVSALVNLGYGRPQAAHAVAKGLAALGETAATAALIRRGLKELAQ